LSEQISLPKGWVETTVGTFLTLEYGKGLSKKDRKEGNVPVFGSSGINGYHNKALVENSSLVIGRKGNAGNVLLVERPFWAIDTTYFLKETRDYNIKFLYYLFKFLNFGKLDSSTAIPSLRRDDVYAQSILLPPLNEQKRIVSKIEELFSKLDNVRDTLQKVKLQLVQYRQSLLKSAFEGKLTEEWRETNQGKIKPVSKLCEMIEEDSKSQVTPTNFSETEVSLPDTWCWIKLGEITDNHDGERIPVNAKNRESMKGKYPYYGASGIIDYVNKPIFNGKYLLIGEDGANLISRSVPLAFIAEGKFWVNNHAHILTTWGDIPLEFLSNYINSVRLTKWITGTAQPKLNQNNLKKIPVPVSPLEEQREIILQIEQGFSLIKNTENITNTMLKQLDTLRSSILKQAFEGKLVPQDPNDESAEKLLEQIKEQKQSQQTKAKSRGKK
jgi:type I restriction enzyme, S subunit